MKRLFVVLGLVFSAGQVRSQELSKGLFDPLADYPVTGTWKPAEGTGAEFAKWEINPTQISVTTMPNDKRDLSFELVRVEPMPEGDWTLRLLVQSGDAPFSLRLGEQKNGRANGLQIYCDTSSTYITVAVPRDTIYGRGAYMPGAGGVKMISIAYSPSRKIAQVMLNGGAIRFPKVSVVLPRSPLVLTVYQHGRAVERKVSFWGVREEAGAQINLPLASGIAFKGWRDINPPPDGHWPATLVAQLETLAGEGQAAATRANAVAGLLLAERTVGPVSDARWQQAVTLIEQALRGDSAAQAEISFLLPVAVASASEAQRPITRDWAARLTEQSLFASGLTFAQFKNDALWRFSSVDPALVAGLTKGQYVPLDLIQALASDLKPVAPETAIGLYGAFIGQESRRSALVGWLFPELRALNPNYTRLVPTMPREDLVAYQMATEDLPFALDYLEKVTNPEVKAEALEALLTRLKPEQSAKLSGRVESLLIEVVEKWKPANTRDDSPVPQMVRLAEWQWKHDAPQKAEATLQAAMTKLAKLPPARFRDTWAIARLLRQMQHVQAGEWMKKAQEAAILRDREADGGGGGVYLSATVLIVRALVQDGALEEAAAMLKTLDRNWLEDNYQMGQSLLINAWFNRDETKARARLDALPPGRQRDSLMASDAVRVAKKDLAAGLARLEMVPETSRLIPLFRIAEDSQIEKSPAAMEAIGKAIAAHLIEWRKIKRHDTHSMLLKNLAKMRLETLLALEPYLKEDPQFQSWQLLSGVARSAGLANDPVWQRLARSEKVTGGSIVWAPDRLRDVVRAVEFNRDQEN